MKAFFMGADKDYPKCSVYEGGLNFNKFLSHSSVLDTYFFNSSSSNPLPDVDVDEFDIALFYYHFQVWKGYTKEFFDAIHIPKILVNCETRMHPWNTPCHLGKLSDIFDYQIIPDTNMIEEDNVLLLPRVIERTNFPKRPVNIENPIISTYGFPSGYKDTVGTFLAIQDEFDNATYRVNFSPDSRFGASNFMRDRFEECKKRNTKPGIKLEFSEEFMPKNKLLSWLNESDLNIFFYDERRDLVTLGTFPISIDAAIAAQRPIAVQRRQCTSYLCMYLKPYPEYSLKQIMENSESDVQELYDDSDMDSVAKLLDEWLIETFE